VIDREASGYQIKKRGTTGKRLVKDKYWIKAIGKNMVELNNIV